MKKLVFLIFMCVVSAMRLSAQEKDVTKFLGIPVDGTKSAMVQKLCQKGFVYDRQTGLLEGEFNGRKVIVSVVTNNNKVWRIMLQDAVASHETDIKIRFNTLCRQFAQNSKYCYPYFDDEKDYIISDSEDISHQILISKKRYGASFWQCGLPKEVFMKEFAAKALKLFEEKEGLSAEELNEKYSPEEFAEKFKKYAPSVLDAEFEKLSKKSVWFMINETYGRYEILMYYDNECNRANGEDL